MRKKSLNPGKSTGKITKIAFTVLGKRWVARLLSKKEFLRRYGASTLANTTGYLRIIDFSPCPGGYDKESVVHELVHAYSSELCLGSTNDIHREDAEEIYAEFFSKRGRELLHKADMLYDQMQAAVS